MSIQEIKNSLGEYAKDIKLNLSSILTKEGSPELTESQIRGIALATSYSTKNAKLSAALLAEWEGKISEEEIKAAKAAASLMAMNNIYYRFTHMVGDAEYAQMPAKLRMNFMANPGVDKLDFELYSLAVSAINGCGMCIKSHVKQAASHGLSKQAIQSCIRIAATINATAQAIEIG